MDPGIASIRGHDEPATRTRGVDGQTDRGLRWLYDALYLPADGRGKVIAHGSHREHVKRHFLRLQRGLVLYTRLEARIYPHLSPIPHPDTLEVVRLSSVSSWFKSELTLCPQEE